MAKKRAAILGSSGMIGQRFAHMLLGHPYFQPVAYCASDRSEGKTMAEVWRLSDVELDARLAEEVVQATDAAKLAKQGVEVVFGGLPSEVAGPIEDACADAGMAVFSNAASHRMENDTPILNATAQGLADGHRLLVDLFKHKDLIAALFRRLIVPVNGESVGKVRL